MGYAIPNCAAHIIVILNEFVQISFPAVQISDGDADEGGLDHDM